MWRAVLIVDGACGACCCNRVSTAVVVNCSLFAICCLLWCVVCCWLRDGVRCLLLVVGCCVLLIAVVEWLLCGASCSYCWLAS